MNTAADALGDVRVSDLLTYEEAGEELGIKVGAIKAAVVAGRLHPVKLPGSKFKFLSRAEVAEYGRSRYQRRTTPAIPAAVPTAPGMPSAVSVGELAARVEALSGPTLAGLRDGLEKLSTIAVAAALGMSMQNGEGTPDPKRLAGMLRR